ncbi:head GIN domain-containing protein [Zeaxanthinibacter enoshimensis]|uniref:Putative autotransporter adhesin-like protein n=1 Tax=Zeaxanthinibacter enoshimensis TaxID=392009 RepID=A0A4R6TMS3_9FLAO|nr:head GIN domain-containing protein [Zeaxanthinibacter enoshimensis]TDQ32822.1 putative autotransporter adhesin-like protein [Zeaxanthinibacter enoshimensis]
MNILRLLLFFTLAIPVASAQQKVTQELQQFKEIKVYDGLSVKLIRSDVNKAVISGANTDKVALVNNDGVLKIRMEIDKLFAGYRTFVELHYNQPLLVIDVNEDARISSDKTIKQQVLELKAQEGGELDINAEVEQMLIKSVTGGIINARGVSDLQDVAINTGGIYYGKNFKTKFSTVNVNAGSTAEIFATDYAKVTVKAGGEVLVYGDPAKMDEKTVFGGRIKRM